MDKKKENKRPYKLILLIAGISLVLLLTFGGLTIYFLIRNSNKDGEKTTRLIEISTSTLNVPLTSSRTTTRTFFRTLTTTELNDDDDLEDYIIVRSTTTTKTTTPTTTIEDTDQDREIELNDDDLENFLDELNSSTTTRTSTTTTTSNNTPNRFLYGIRIHSNFSNATGCDDCTFGPIKTETNFIFQNKSFNSFNISSNGLVTFKNDFYSLVIRPFFSDIDMRNKGFINYGEIKDAEKIEEIGLEISSLCKYGNYTPSWAYLVTWYECAAYTQYSFLSNYVNTFQLLLVSNGNDSFAMFNFIRMDWPNSYNYKEFSSGYDLNYYSIFSMRPELKVSIENKSVQNLIQKSNMGKAGRWFISFNNTRCRF